jgi:hypothetical protein
MKLDLTYIKDILNVVNNSEDDYVELDEIITKLNTTDETLKKLRHHLRLLCESGFLQSSDMINFGFKAALNNQVFINNHTSFYFTMDGYNLLESLNNNTLFDKISNGLKDLGIETLKQIPALAIECIKKHYLGF